MVYKDIILIVIMLDITKPIVLVDCSYFVFYRYYATRSWYQRAMEKDIDCKTVCTDNVFIDKYTLTWEKSIKDMSKEFKTVSNNIIFARDCSRDNIWRMELYPTYKAGRDEKENSFNGDIFKYTYQTLIPILKEKYNFKDIQHDKLEADDMIALFVKRINEKGNVSCIPKITIITNDNDYVQLYKYNVEIFNIQGKSLRDRIDDVPNYLQYKIIIGDKSDNIVAVAKKVGDKTAKKMIADPVYYEKIMGNPGAMQQMELNRKLIDFDSIPELLVKQAYSVIDKLLKI